MTSSFIIGCVAVLGYCVFLFGCLILWLRYSRPQVIKQLPLSSVSILIPVRNEASNILKTLEGVLSQHYPGGDFEVLVIDDHSSDSTVEIVTAFLQHHVGLPLRLIRLEKEGSKKAAIAAGVEAAQYQWIVTTDGDVVVAKNWLSALMSYAGDEAVGMVCGPVLLRSLASHSLVANLVTMESLGLTAIAAAGISANRPFFCNGANLAYRKRDFLDRGGYLDSQQHLTGDDTALLLKFSSHEVRYVYSAEGVVSADPAHNISTFIRQRQRWASKIPGTLTYYTIALALVAWLAHASLLVGLFMVLQGQLNPFWFLGITASKTVMEYGLLKVVGRYFHQPVNFLLILGAQPFYWLAIVIIGFLSVFVPYSWKGRSSN